MSQGCGWGRAAHFTPAPAVPVPARAGVDPRDRVVEAARAYKFVRLSELNNAPLPEDVLRRAKEGTELDLFTALDALDGGAR